MLLWHFLFLCICLIRRGYKQERKFALNSKFYNEFYLANIQPFIDGVDKSSSYKNINFFSCFPQRGVIALAWNQHYTPSWALQADAHERKYTHGLSPSTMACFSLCRESDFKNKWPRNNQYDAFQQQQPRWHHPFLRVIPEWSWFIHDDYDSLKCPCVIRMFS